MPVWGQARIAALRLLLRVATSGRQRVFAPPQQLSTTLAALTGSSMIDGVET